MNYVDEESREAFHMSHTTLQLICHVLESKAFLYGAQVEFIDSLDDGAAILAVADLTRDQQEGLAAQVNEQFKRVDGKPTCTLTDQDFGTFVIESSDRESIISN